MPGIGLGLTARRGGLSPAIAASLPSLDLDFLQQRYQMSLIGKAFSEIFTFSRASAGTRINASGVMETVAANQPRFDYDPVTLQPKGILIEEQRTNLVLNSDDIGQASWFKSGATVSGKKLVESSANEAHRVLSNAGISLSVGSVCMTTVVKPSGRNHAYFRLNGASGDVYSGNVRLSDAVVTQTHSGSISAVLLSSGEVKVTCSGSVTVAGNHWPEVRVSNSDTYANYSGDGVSGIEILWSQLEQGSFPTSYIPTSGSQVTRAADVCSINTLSPWYAAAEGTLFVEVSADRSNDNRDYQLLGFGSGAQGIGRFSGGSIQVHDGSTYRALPNSLCTTPGVKKVAVTYKSGDTISAAAIGGVSGNYTSDGSLIDGSAIAIGTRLIPTAFWNGYIRKLNYFPRRLSAAQLQSLTA